MDLHSIKNKSTRDCNPLLEKNDNNMKNILLTLLLIIFTALPSLAQLQGEALIDSLEAELPKAKADTNDVNLLNRLCYSYNSINPEKGIEFGEKGLALAKEIDWKKGEATSYNNLGVNYMNQSDYPQALEYYGRALKINEYLGDKKEIATNLGNMGIVYQNQSDYPKALEYYHRALDLHEKLGGKSKIAIGLGNIGIVYHRQSNHPKALEYYHKALKIDEELGNKNGVARHLGNIGLVYKDQLDYSKALEYYRKALNINKELDNKAGVASLLGNIGNVYNDQSDYSKAFEYYDKALKIAEEVGYKNGVARHIGNMGELYLKLSQDTVNISPNELNKYVSLNRVININNAIEYSKEAISIFEEIGELGARSYFLENLAEAYKLKGDYKKWGEALEEHHRLKDSIFNKENTKRIEALTAERDKIEAEKIASEEARILAEKKA
ncbi:MAG: hypothetical protein Kapaf2KO_21180 [Candidatus Kapaibacteriales bacterium]